MLDEVMGNASMMMGAHLERSTGAFMACKLADNCTGVQGFLRFIQRAVGAKSEGSGSQSVDFPTCSDLRCMVLAWCSA